MSFDIQVARRLGDQDIACALVASAGITALFGPSGAGKTSILNMVAGLLRPDSGRIVVAGECLFDSATGVNVPPARRHSGYIFQDARLFPHMSVRANLAYGERRGRRDAGGTAALLGFDDVMGLLGIGHLLRRTPASLSGGEAQRVAIGRALLSRPRFFLMDEPLSSLDRTRRQDILAMIAHLHAVTAIPILYVSHDRDEVDYLAHAVITLPQ